MSKAHHSDHSGAHARGTSYHERHANTLANGNAHDEGANFKKQMQPMPSVPPKDPGVSGLSLGTGGTGDGTDPLQPGV